MKTLKHQSVLIDGGSRGLGLGVVEALAARDANVTIAIQKAAPQATEKISYGIPTFALEGNLVHFAAFKNHIGFYPMPSAITAFGKELSSYKCSTGAVQFPLDEPLTLVSRMVKFRVKQKMMKRKKN